MNVIIDILAIKCDVSLLQNDLEPNLIQTIRSLRLPKFSQFDIKKIQEQFRKFQSIEKIFNSKNFNFSFNS